ncbi:MAG: hypothetical protein ACREO4_16205 [Lysobacter sp.]
MPRVLGIFLASLLAACGTVPTAQQQQAADYGQPIAQEAAERLATAYLSARLKDPGSAQYRWEPVAKGFMAASPLARRKLTYGYFLTGTVNSKNSFGGYTGASRYSFVFRDGVLVGADREECLSPGNCHMAPF